MKQLSCQPLRQLFSKDTLCSDSQSLNKKYSSVCLVIVRVCGMYEINVGETVLNMLHFTCQNTSGYSSLQHALIGARVFNRLNTLH